MMTKGPLSIQATNLSHAWAQAFLTAAAPGGNEITPLTVTVTGFIDNKPIETPSIKQALDQALLAHEQSSCETVANTIFPQSMWNPSAGREALFQRYTNIMPGLKKLKNNGYGLYFERLIAFGPGPDKVNQLDHIIRTYRGGNHRRSALQAAIFDPSRDHTNQPRRGFPCMQQVAFVPDGNELAVTAFYAVQHLFEKAYGNYLGLCRLGHFMAHEMGLQLTRLTCMTSVARLGEVKKKDIQELCQKLKMLTASS